MKLKFKRVWAKNFRSLDNAGMELLFQPGNTMVGSIDNGAGKSTLCIWVLYYVLFDKPYGKGTSKSQLINSRSNKDCVGEVEFEANGSTWLVRRGQKPTLFQIFKDGVEIKDEASLKNHQANLDAVIGMDEKAFCNTIALGEDKFVPFVSMSAADRRNYGEQMLDLVVISRMNENNKIALKELNSKQSGLLNHTSSLSFRISATENIINVKKQHAASVTAGLDDQINALVVEKETLLAAVPALNAEGRAIRVEIEPVKQSIEELRRLEVLKDQFKTRIDTIINAIKMAQVGGHCNHCGQPLPADKMEAHKQSLKEQGAKIRAGALEIDAKIAACPPGLKEKLAELEAKLQTVTVAFSANETQVNFLNRSIRALQEKKESQSKTVDWSSEEAELEALKEDMAKSDALIKELAIEIKSAEVIAASLRDDGVKAKVVDEFLPFINDRVNFYLDKMNLFIHIELTNEFEIKMNSPDRRGQTINSLSTGQQRRVDLAILLSWRDVAKAASACDSNLLILDEILENLSYQGVEDFLEMWRLNDVDQEVCLYVITQRNNDFEPLFDRSILYALKDDSTYLHQES